MKKWELARYLIDAKKCVDSIIFINNNSLNLNIDIRKNITAKRDKFYINCCVVLDECFKNKKKLCDEDKIAKTLYYERDKNTAHKDSNYVPKKYTSLKELENDLKQQLRHVKKICKKKLPDVITLDFVSHDYDLFRFLKGFNKKIEDELKKEKYESYSQIPDDLEIINDMQSSIKEQYNIVTDTEDIKAMNDEEKQHGAVIFQDGLNDYEGLQMRQDSAITLNVLHNTDIWAFFNVEVKTKITEMRKSGLFDEFNRPQQMTVLHNTDFLKKILLEDIENIKKQRRKIKNYENDN
ncbi:hypothetical protein [Carnobacterium maltaromaticum]|uniref:hypothetical protein n=1 Tax=Carnobacterium maltaromaticum TaxID=2751 RepID=UPI00295E77B2|nr:hypothetical protein [Carnobacterium maltaromaticum]